MSNQKMELSEAKKVSISLKNDALNPNRIKKENQVYMIFAEFMADMSRLTFSKSGKWLGPIKITQPRRVWLIAKIAFRIYCLIMSKK